jgi:hypothetical protein
LRDLRDRALGNAAALVFFLFDLLHLDGDDLGARPLIERKARLAELLSHAGSPLQYSDHQTGHGRAFHEKACAMSLEAIVSKRADVPYTPGDRGLWLKDKPAREVRREAPYPKPGAGDKSAPPGPACPRAAPGRPPAAAGCPLAEVRRLHVALAGYRPCASDEVDFADGDVGHVCAVAKP